MMRWKSVSVRNLPFHVDAKEGVSFQGAPWLPTKSELYFFWRYAYPWGVATVHDYELPFWAYFATGETIMHSWWRMNTGCVAVRVGPGVTTFYFCRDDGSLLNATRMKGLFSRRQVREQYPNALLI